MVNWFRISEILAKEAQYRAGRRTGSMRRLSFGTGSLLKSNLVTVAFFSMFSTTFGFMVTSSPALGLGFAGLMELFFGIITTAPALQNMVSDKLLDPLAYLPLNEREIRKSLLYIVLYWGGIGLLFIVLPAAVAGALLTHNLYLILWGSLEAVSLLLLSVGIGYIAGSVSPKLSGRPLSRILSTLAWLAVMSFGFVFMAVNNFSFSHSPQSSLKTSKDLLEAIPPFSFGSASAGSPLSVTSSLAFLLFSMLLFKTGADRFWRALSAEMLIVKPGSDVKLQWKLWSGPLPSPVFKDLKLLIRNSRMLASTIYVFFIPLFAASPFFFGSVHKLYSLILILMPWMGTAVGSAVGNLYLTEGSDSRFLYLLPITKGSIVRSKALALAVLAIPISLMYFLLMMDVPLIGAKVALAFLLSSIGFLFLDSYLIMMRLPREMASWSRQTLGQGWTLIMLLVDMVVAGVMTAVSLIPLFIRWSLGISLPLRSGDLLLVELLVFSAVVVFLTNNREPI